jgi:hypothetical protein
MQARIEGVLIPALALVFSVAYLTQTRGLAAESTIFPRTVMTFLCLLGAGVAITEWRGARVAGAGGASQAPLVFVMTLLYVTGFWLAGFALAAPVFLAATLILLGEPKLRSVVVAVVLPAAVYLLFSTIFGVKL